MTNEQRIEKLEQRVRDLEEAMIKNTGRNYDDIEAIHRRLEELSRLTRDLQMIGSHQ